MMHDDIPALLPCPFCGNSAVRFNQRPLGISWVVECINCRARGPEIHVQYEDGKDRTELSGKAKKKAAYMVLVKLMKSAGICDPEWERIMWTQVVE